ncbi:MAG TPA: DotU family type IV/VI secretion system protein [Thermoanaerobaculia bacterium]|nr:DotU family type IV/VI secretion system protein [Thermoanaerobaculia bacterium]
MSASPSIPADPLLRFRRYAGELTEILDELAAGTLGGANASAPAVYDEVRLRLTPYLAPAPSGVAVGPNFESARYLMAAFGDDVFENLDWPGQVAWQRAPLEQQYFNTTDGGTVILQRIDQLLEVPSLRSVPMAKMYLIALALGFQGDLRGTPGGSAKLAARRGGLGALVAAAEPPPSGAGGRLFPDAYRHTLEGGKPRRLPRLAGWAAAVLAILLAWWALSWPLWHDRTEDLRTVLRGLLAIPSVGAAPAASPPRPSSGRSGPSGQAAPTRSGPRPAGRTGAGEAG